MALGGQVEGGVGGVEVGLAPAPVGEAGDGHLPEHGGEHAGMSGLHRGPVHAVGVDHGAQALLAAGPQVQVVLVEQAHQLPALAGHPILQLGVAEGGRPVAVEEADHLLEAGPAAGEAVVGGAARRHSPPPRAPRSGHLLQRLRCRRCERGWAAGGKETAMTEEGTDRPWAATRRGLADKLGQIEGVLPGSVVVRHMRCGKAACACKADPPTLHGPYIQWTRTVEGKTVTRFLTPEQLTRYRSWFDNARRLKDLVAKLETVSVQALESESRRGRTAQAPKTTGARSPRRFGT